MAKGSKFVRCIRRFCSSAHLSPKYSRNVVVTGIGITSPLGCKTDEVWSRLIQGHCAVSSVEGEVFKKLPSRVAAYVPRDQVDEKYFNRTRPVVTSYVLAAADNALNDARWSPETERDQCNTGVSIGIGMTDMELIYQSWLGLEARGPRVVSPHFVPRILTNLPAGEVSIRRQLKGPNHAVSTACATGAHAIGDAMRMIAHGDCDVMVAGGADACITPLGFAGFTQIRALSKKFNDNPEKASRPFDIERDGFVMGEGAAVLVLEEETHAHLRGAQVYARIAGYGLSCDASNIVAPPISGDGPRRAMLNSVQDSGISVSDVQYINAHATSTPQGDIAEANAITSAFHHSVAVSSTKGAVGHLLGGAGAIEAAFTVLSCFHGVIPPTVNLSNLDPEIKLDCVGDESRRWTSRGPRVAISNSFGFGGTNAALVFASV